MPLTEKNHLLDHTLSYYDRTAKTLEAEFPISILERLRHCRARIELTLSPKLEDGKMHIFKAFVVRHNNALGPSKGGIRMTTSTSIDEITALAMEMSWKCALIGVPFGGGKSGIVADSESFSPTDKEIVIRSFARNASRSISPSLYVPAPDMGTNERDMGHMKDTITRSSGDATTLGCYVTGKPVILGGILGRREATGQGVAIVTMQAMKLNNIDVKNATAIVQGFGNVGSVAAKALADFGVKIIAISDIHGALYNRDGIDIAALQRHVNENQSIIGYANAEPIDGLEMLEMECDVLVPAAQGGQITSQNVERLKCKIIAEGANGPTTPEADTILTNKGILVCPDILCNAGGVFVSYLEYAQETQQEQMEIEQVQARLHKRMSMCFTKTWETKMQNNISFREAAMQLAVRRVVEGLVAKGMQA